MNVLVPRFSSAWVINYNAKLNYVFTKSLFLFVAVLTLTVQWPTKSLHINQLVVMLTARYEWCVFSVVRCLELSWSQGTRPRYSGQDQDQEQDHGSEKTASRRGSAARLPITAYTIGVLLFVRTIVLDCCDCYLRLAYTSTSRRQSACIIDPCTMT